MDQDPAEPDLALEISTAAVKEQPLPFARAIRGTSVR